MQRPPWPHTLPGVQTQDKTAAADTNVPAPIFILASQRSFTSLFCAMIGQHPAVYGVPEINLFCKGTVSDLMRYAVGERQYMIHGLWRAVAQLYGGEQTLETVEMARRWLNARTRMTTGELYTDLCQRVAPLCVTDKSPAYAKNARAMRRMRSTFPHARYIYMTRHPKDQGKSVMGAPQAMATLFASDSVDYETQPPTIDPQFVWYETQRKILDFLDTIPPAQQFQIRGELLVSDPKTHLAEICRWLGLAWNDDIYAQMLRTEDSPYASMGPFGCQWGNNPGFQKSPVFRQSPIKDTPLEGPLAWRKDKKPFRPEILELAKKLGYS